MSYSLIRVGKVWHYRFQVAGERVQCSTRETARGRADAVAQKAYDEARLWARSEEAIPTLDELVTQWLLTHEKTASAAHLKSIETFGRLHTYQLGGLLVTKITTAEVEEARSLHLGAHSRASGNHWLAVLKLVVNWAVGRQLLPQLPWKVKLLKVQKAPRTTLPTVSAKAWFAAVDRAAARAPNVATCVRLMFGLGLRELEAAGARWEWIDWERKTYTPGKTKGREAEPVPMPGWLMEHLAPKRRTEGVIAPSLRHASVGPYTAGYARAAMTKANEECGLKGLTPHRLRGTFATMLSEAGVPIQTIQKVMRHKDPMTTMKYLEVNLELAAQAQQRIGAMVGFTTERPAQGNDMQHPEGLA